MFQIDGFVENSDEVLEFFRVDQVEWKEFTGQQFYQSIVILSLDGAVGFNFCHSFYSVSYPWLRYQLCLLGRWHSLSFVSFLLHHVRPFRLVLRPDVAPEVGGLAVRQLVRRLLTLSCKEQTKHMFSIMAVVKVFPHQPLRIVRLHLGLAG